MSTTITIFSINDVSNMKLWDSFVNDHPESTPFHTSGWLKCLKHTFAFQDLLYVVLDQNGKIDGVFPAFRINRFFSKSRIVSLPFSDYGGYLFRDSKAGCVFLTDLLQEKIGDFQNVEIRSKVESNVSFHQHTHYKRHVLCLNPDPNEVLKNIEKRTIQYCIRKAQKNGVTIVENNTEDGVAEFYRLNYLTRNKHGLPAQSKRFFENIFKELIEKGQAFINLAIYKNKAIASGMFFRFRDTVYYKYSASDPSYLIHQTPNHLLTCQAIEQACLAGFKYFDFGRTSMENPGLMRYKEMWGAQAIDLPYNYFPRVCGAASYKEDNIVYQIFTTLWRMLPSLITRRIGPLLCKYSA